MIIQWVIERDERVRNAQAAFDANQKEIARLQAFVDRYVPPPSFTSFTLYPSLRDTFSITALHFKSCFDDDNSANDLIK